MSAQVTHRVTQATTTDPTARPSLGRLRSAWYRIRFTIAEMNYAAQRLVGAQVPWIVDDQWHAR